MKKSEFGKDLGLMHEVVTMGRKVGFGRDDWSRIAHWEEGMSETLNFVRRCKTTQLPAELPINEKIQKLAAFLKLIEPFLNSGYECIACEPRKSYDCERGKRNASRLLPGYHDLGIQLSESDETSLKEGKCYQPILHAHAMLKEFLGIEAPGAGEWPPSPEWQMFGPKATDGYYNLKGVVTPLTSLKNILDLKSAMKKNSQHLKVELIFPDSD